MQPAGTPDVTEAKSSVLETLLQVEFDVRVIALEHSSLGEL